MLPVLKDHTIITVCCLGCVTFLAVITRSMAVGIFDLHLINNTKSKHTVGQQLCKDLGYDGLAVLSSPEAYRLGLEIRAPVRLSDKSRVSVGLYFKSNSRSLRWADDGMVADDTPWADPSPVVSETKPFGRLKGDGTLLTTGNAFETYSLCGKQYTKEAFGKKLFGKKPDGQTSYISQKKTTSFMRCVGTCSTTSRCRAAEYNLNISTCTIFDTSMFSGFSQNEGTNTFIRDGY
ncbi:hypothetical protein RRG08_028659 [Elysia crispata]|uniref:Apple domain-containing protein n=1 Tax=Elysia crispata TaxID=231223 RepID=A0AAE0ZD56_9GAST|nr:hypothetical protein RRG08_028659 [Elysia crispata]